MPELPEVETTVSILNKLIKGLEIKDVWSDYNSVFHQGKNNIKNLKYFADFANEIRDRKILRLARRGKNVLMELSGGLTILIHLKMTGHLLFGSYRKVNALSPLRKQGSSKLVWRAAEKGALQEPINQFIRFVLTLSNGKHLALSDLRRFAKVTLIKTNETDTDPELKNIGPEPLRKDFNFDSFAIRILKRKRTPIKQVLLDQTVIAGIGNIYSDEMLWYAGIHPLSITGAIDKKTLRSLFQSMRKVLRNGIRFKGDSMSDFRLPSGKKGGYQKMHRAYRRTGERCSLCGGKIKRLKIGGRSAHFCPKHQKLFN